MRVSHWLVGLFLCLSLILAFQSFAQNPSQSSQVVDRGPRYEYATLNTQKVQENNRMVYSVTWNAGPQDIVGRSGSSILDARRRLMGQLRIQTNNRANLSVLLSGLGSDGWRLVESTESEAGITRIFIRAAN